MTRTAKTKGASKRKSDKTAASKIEPPVEQATSAPASVVPDQVVAGRTIRDRIKELRRVKAGSLLANPRNWRLHPDKQRSALSGILREVGIADALLARETPEGLMLIDGHLRADTSPDLEWPVLILDVTEEEADKLLASLDPLSAMADTDAAMLTKLLHSISADDEDLKKLLAELEADNAPPVPPDDFPESGEDIETDCTCPKCGYRFSGGRWAEKVSDDDGNSV